MSIAYRWLLGVLLAAMLAGGAYGYISYQAVEKERAAVALKQLEANAELQTKYNKLSSDYQVLKAKKELVRTEVVTREDKLINENRSYYDGECFNADSLQHIQSAQSGN